MNKPDEIETIEGLHHIGDMRSRGLDRIGVDQYISEDFYQQELDTIWRKCWLWAGRAAEISNVGDYFVFNLPFLDKTSIIVIRGKDDKIRGFYNACQHRGGRLAYYEKGSCKAMTCTFHGWVFDLEGNLADVPEAEVYGELDHSKLGLKQVSVDTWGGWVFVNLDPEPRWTLAEYLAPVPAPLADYFEQEPWHWGSGRKGLFKCNWKLQVDAQAEGIHAPFLHGRSIMGKFDMADVPMWANFGSPGVPYRGEVHRPDMPDAGPGVFQSPLAGAVSRYSTSMYYNTDSDEWREKSSAEKYPGAVNPSDGERWAFDIYHFFPNTVIMVQKGYVLIMRSWPRAVGETLWDYDNYFTEQPTSFGEQLARLHGSTEMRNTITEDMTTVEGLYDSYKSGGITELVISEPEIGLSNYETQVIQMVKTLQE
jgi:phenylpropionate dioxygenase-like ring-hydroxylating dioxygenase large terminal subunit